MGELVEQRLRVALKALVDRDTRALAGVTAHDSRIGDLQVEIDGRCFTLLALQQPVATDLRIVMSILKINNDVERVGDFAVHIGEVALRYFQYPPVKPLIDVPRMGNLALKMFRQSLDALVSNDVELAQEVLGLDDWLDAYKDQIFREVLTYMLGDKQTIEPGIDLILLSRHLERIGDHATNIAEDVIFIAEGRDVRHGSLGRLSTERRKSSAVPPA